MTVAFWLASHATAFARDIAAFQAAFAQADVLPLGSGAISGTSLPIDRECTRELLGFASVSTNAARSRPSIDSIS